MNWLDIVIIIALIIPIFLGLFVGFIKTVLSLVGMIVGVVLASNFYQGLAGMLTFISNRSIANIVAFIIILAAVILVATLVAIFLRAILRATKLGWLDRIAGAVLGFLTGAILISAILAGIVKFFGEGLVTESILAGVLLDKLPLVLGLLPGEFDVIRNFFR
jgi:membrane protein required for colicin V production